MIAISTCSVPVASFYTPELLLLCKAFLNALERVSEKKARSLRLFILNYYLAIEASKKEWYAEGILQYLPLDEDFNTHTHQTPNNLSNLLSRRTDFHFGLLWSILLLRYCVWHTKIVYETLICPSPNLNI